MRQACPSVSVNQAKVVPWFPTKIEDIDRWVARSGVDIRGLDWGWEH